MSGISDDYTTLRNALREVARNVYIVNEKHPPSYERKWKVHVLWDDGTTSTTWVADNDAALHAEMRRLLHDPRASVTGSSTTPGADG